MAANFKGFLSVKRILDLWNYVRKHRPESKDQIVNFLLSKDYVASKRTIERDFETLKDFLDVEIRFNRKTGVYDCSSANEGSFNEAEVHNLMDVLALEQHVRVGLNNVPALKKLVSFDHDRNQESISEPLLFCLKAIVANKVIEIEHLKFDGKSPSVRLLLPILLVERANRWYLIAEEYTSSEIRTFGLERIKAYRMASTAFKFRKPKLSAVQLNDKLSYNVGVFNILKEPEWVTIKFSKMMAKYFETQPLSPEWEVLEETQEKVILRFKVVINQDLELKIITWSDEVEVISPPALLEAVVARLNKTIAKMPNNPFKN